MRNVLLAISVLIVSGLTYAVNLLPQANLKVSDYRIELGKEVILDASDSLNPQGQRYGLQYRFKPNTREKWSKFSSSPIFRYLPTKTGNQTAYLEIQDTEKGYVNRTIRNYRVIDPQNKSARIIVLNQGTIHAGEEVFFQIKFNVPSNTDTQQTRVRWDFNNDGRFDTPFQIIQTASYVFYETKTIRPRAEVLFPDGDLLYIKGIELIGARSRDRTPQSDFKKIRITSAQINAPIVNLVPSYRVYNENTAIKFDASKTRTNTTSWIEFQFDGQKTITNQTIIKRKFKSPGHHQIITRHCYNRSQPTCAETTTNVYVRANPTDFSVKFTVYDVSGSSMNQNTGSNKNFYQFNVGKPLRFQANVQHLSSRAQHYEYRWDFDGDLKYDTPFSHKNFAEKIYARPGNHTVTVQVKNEFTRENEQIVLSQKTLKIVNNEIPYGYFKIQKLYKNKNDDPKHPKIFVGDQVRIIPVVKDIDAYASQVKTRFDIDGDGRWETDFQHTGGFEWKFVSSGEYKAKMQIKDSNGVVKTIKQTFTIFDNNEPQIKVTVSKKQIAIGETITFNAKKSNGNGLIFSWDIPENYSPKNSTLAQITAQFKTTGKKMIGLTITDSFGISKWVQFPVWVK